MEEGEYTDSTRVIIVNTDEKEVGLIVDAAYDVIDIPADAVEPAPKVAGSIDTVYLSGVAKLDKRLLILLHLGKVLRTDELKQLHQIEGLR
jgi:purine-binding chemotaxis protein CheW